LLYCFDGRQDETKRIYSHKNVVLFYMSLSSHALQPKELFGGEESDPLGVQILFSGD
jgi:hypothetical protein